MHLRPPLRILAALLLCSTAACGAVGRFFHGGTNDPGTTAAARGSAARDSATRDSAARDSTAAVTPRPAPPRIDPAAPVAAADYGGTLRARRTALAERGLTVAPADVGYYMDVQEARLRQLGGATLRLSRRDLSVVVELPGTITFSVGGARLSTAARTALADVARVLVDYRNTIVSIAGHTDDSGDAAGNRLLSEQRATAVARELIASGVEAERLVVVGYGAERPIGDNATEVGREANRRVVLRIDPLRR